MDYTHLNDETLLNLIAHSQESALSVFYDRYCRLVYNIALNAISDPARAEEITQDVFVRVWENARTYRAEEGRVIAWLTSIARNRSIDVFRRGRVRREDQHISWDEIESYEPPSSQNVEAEVDLAQRQRKVRWAVSQLPAEQRQALGMAYFQGLSHLEIANELDEPLGTVKTRIRLGMQKLRSLLQGESFE